MDAGRASRTAMATALMRSIHTRTDRQPILNDTWGDDLVPETVKEEFAMHAAALADAKASTANADHANGVEGALKSNPAYANVVARTRYTEDALLAAIRLGIKQYVLIGAGFDSFILRHDLKSAGLKVFEIDHPATQQLKKQRIAERGLSLDANVHLLPSDLASESLSDVLAKSEFDRGAKSFFSWLGVSMYLDRESNVRALQDIRRCAAAGSELVFTYFDQSVFDHAPGDATTQFVELQSAVTALGEPLLSGFHPSSLHSDLAGIDFSLLADSSDEEIVRRYDPGNANGLVPMLFSRIAHLRVADGV